jgi:hypothetical protein
MDIIAAIYDTLFNIFNQTYYFIFTIILKDGGYLKFFLVATIIPLILYALFYFVWKYPYGKWWHWLTWLFVLTLVVFGVTYGVANIQILASNEPNMVACYNDPNCLAYAESLPAKYAMVNIILALITGIIYSIIMKQFSKIQAHLPI